MEWSWLKRYRAWRANRKQFLYPENYLEPEHKEAEPPPPSPAKPDKDE